MIKREINYETIRKQEQVWTAWYENNNMEGRKNIKFTNGQQWEAGIVDRRFIDGKESLTFNLTIKHSRRMKAQSKQIEFSLNLSPVNEEYAKNNVEETNAFRMLISSTLLSNDVLKVLSNTLDKCLDFGYAFVEMGFKRESDKTLCLVPDIRLHEDPAIAFWDKNAKSPTKIDGRFCGLRRVISEEEFLSKYPEYIKKDHSWLHDKDNELYDYWYRVPEEKDFVKLKGGVYKQQDCLSLDDQDNIDNENPDVKKGFVDCIYQIRYCNEFKVGDPIKYPTTDLPLVFHPALRVWSCDQEDTFPFTYHLKGAQTLHNYVNSQLATASKNFTGDKWLMNHTHVQSPESVRNAKNLNSRSGAFAFDDDPSTIRREQPAEIPMSMIQLSQSIKQEIDDIAGAMMDNQTTDQADISGVALDKITHNINMLQAVIIAAHIEFVNTVGMLQRQMIPRLYTEERTVIVKKQDGSAAAVTINELLPTGKIKNNIKDIDNNFHYEIKAGPSTVMLKENTRTALREVYAIDPTAFRATADIYVRSLETPYSGELERRFSAMFVDPMLIKYSQGEITLEEFQQYSQQQQQQQAQQAQNNPVAMGQMLIGQAENKKAEVMARDSETKRMDVMGKIKNNEDALKVKLADITSRAHDNATKNELEALQKQLDANREMMEAYTNAQS